MSNQGWIKAYRKFLNWEWYDDANTFRLFIHLLLTANHQEGKWHGVDIKAGEVLTGRVKLSQALDLTEQQVRTSLSKLKSTNEITIKSTKKYSIISIVSWDSYQQDNQQSNQQVTNKQPSSNQQVTTNKNEKNIKNDKNENKYIENFVEYFFTEKVLELKSIIENKIGIKINHYKTWEKELIKFEKKIIGNDKRERINGCILAIEKYTGFEYFPVVNNIEDFCNKFNKIENFLKKLNNGGGQKSTPLSKTQDTKDGILKSLGINSKGEKC